MLIKSPYKINRPLKTPDLTGGVNELVRLAQELNAFKTQFLKTLEEKIRECEMAMEKMMKIQKGEPGKNADENMIVNRVLASIGKVMPRDGKNGENGLDGKNGMDGRPGKDAFVDYERIENFIAKKIPDKKELIKALKELFIEEKKKDLEMIQREIGTLRRQMVLGGGGGGGQGSWKSEIPSGTINGVNKVFTLTRIPATNSLMLQLNQGFPIEDEDFTLSGLTITYETAPPTGSKHRAKFM